ncbi:MAG: (d)CMP kinase [Oscillospiraceae bacterium]|jgi:cytidylate kinase|nr:(d)CMP kinase [Oscillospiraceae bacterium]
MEEKSVAIDGPSGAGKSTLARMAARRFGLIHVDTGALYRCVGLHALRSGVASKDADGVAALLPCIDIEMRHDGAGVQRMYINGSDVTGDIRLPETSIYASDVSALPPVRAFLLDMQKEMANKYNVIMDGRDIGTVVMPCAGLKIFLTAPPEIRAGRRYRELLSGEVETTFDEVLRDIELRDKNDSSRAAAPLTVAGDAVVVDTTRIGLDESFDLLCSIISERLRL